MADFLHKDPLVVNVPVTVTAPANTVAYDFTNDSPFDVDIAWGVGQPVAMTVPPTMVWRGARPYKQLKISGQQWTGIIIATPSYPVGGAPPGGAPAMQLTTMGYFKGNEPPEMLIPMHRLASIGNQVGLGQAFDAVLEASPAVNMLTLLAQTFPLTAAGLNLAGVSAATPGYLVLGYLNCNSGRSFPVPFRINKEGLNQSQAYTLPPSSTGNVQTFTFTSANYLTGLGLFGLNSNTTITNIEVKRLAEPVGSYVSILAATTQTSQIFDLTKIWGAEGFGNLGINAQSYGISVRLTANNAFAGNAGLTLILYGQQLAGDTADTLVSYVDWNSNVYDLLITRLGSEEKLPLNFQVPIPITNPGQTNFGSIRFTVLGPTMGGGSINYNNHYTFDTFIPCIVSFLAPG